MEKVIGKKIRTEASSPIHSNSKNSKNFNKIHLEAIREPKKFFLKQLWRCCSIFKYLALFDGYWNQSFLWG